MTPFEIWQDPQTKVTEIVDVLRQKFTRIS